MTTPRTSPASAPGPNHVPVMVAEDPLTCVARGGGMAMERMDRHTIDLLSTE